MFSLRDITKNASDKKPIRYLSVIPTHPVTFT